MTEVRGSAFKHQSLIQLISPILFQVSAAHSPSFDFRELRTDLSSHIAIALGFSSLLFRRPTVRRLRRSNPRKSFLRPRTGRLTSVARTAPSFLHGRALARRSSPSSSTTALASPFWAKPSRQADLVTFYEPHLSPLYDCYIKP